VVFSFIAVLLVLSEHRHVAAHPLAMETKMKTLMLIPAFVAFTLPAYAATATHKFSPPTISKQQEEAYNQTYTTDMAQEKQLKTGARTHG